MIEKGLRDAIIRLASQMPLRVNSAILFGSHAREEDLQWSDVDLLLISDGFSKMERSDRIGLVIEKWDYVKPVEPICLAPDEVSEADPLIWEICRDGVVIIDDGTFSTVRARCFAYLAENKMKRFEHGYITQE